LRKEFWPRGPLACRLLKELGEPEIRAATADGPVTPQPMGSWAGPCTTYACELRPPRRVRRPLPLPPPPGHRLVRRSASTPQHESPRPHVVSPQAGRRRAALLVPPPAAPSIRVSFRRTAPPRIILLSQPPPSPASLPSWRQGSDDVFLSR
jgi:hypothetical protein